MVNNSSPDLDAVFSALSDATRRGILARLALGGVTQVSDLAEPYPISAPAISKHLRVLEQAGLITREKQGRVRLCRLHAGPLDDAAAWLEQMRNFWEDRLDALARHLSTSPE